MKRLILSLALACGLNAATINFGGMSYDTATGILTATTTGNASAAQGTAGASALQPGGNGSQLTGLTPTQVGLGSVNNTADSAKPVSTAQQAALDLKANLASPTFTGTVTLPSGQALIAPALGTPTSGTLTNCTFPTLNQNTSGSAASLSAPLTFANGGMTGTAATSATTGTMSVSMTTACVTITPTGACTFNAGAGGTAGQEVTFFVTTSGVSSFVLTFGTNYHSIGTLATGTTSARFFTVTFKSNGAAWFEIARTAVQT